MQQKEQEAASPTYVSPPQDRLEVEAEQITSRLDSEGESHRGIGFFRPGSNPSAGRLQRLVRTANVTCPAGQNPFGADRHASALLQHAIDRVRTAQAERAAHPAHPEVVAVGAAVHTAFNRDAAAAATWTVDIPIILRRLEMDRNYIDSVVFTVKCLRAGAGDPACGPDTCTPDTEAFSCSGATAATQIDLCPLFWGRDRNQRARIWMHEVLHINFDFPNDWRQPDMGNPHCYAQFVALLNGFSPPRDFTCH